MVSPIAMNTFVSCASCGGLTKLGVTPGGGGAAPIMGVAVLVAMVFVQRQAVSEINAKTLEVASFMSPTLCDRRLVPEHLHVSRL